MVVSWDFEQVDHSEYKVVVTGDVKSKLMSLLFRRAKGAKEKQIGRRIGKGLDDVSRFDIPSEYLRLIDVAVSSWKKQVFEDVRRDGIHVLTDRVVGCGFVRDGKVWVVRVVLVGDFADKR